MRTEAESFSCVLRTVLSGAGVIFPLLAIGDVSPLAGARWLVPEPLAGATNVTSEFRTSFEATDEGGMRLAIAADTVYAVELNGRTVVESARLPDVPPTRFYDEWDLAGVRRGRNDLVVRHYYQGADSFQHIPGDPGLAFALEADGMRVTSGTNVEWRMSRADRAAGVPMQTGQYGFAFEHDAAAAPAAWRRLTSVECARRVDDGPLVRRPVAPSVTLPAVASRIIATGELDGSPAPEDVAKGMDETAMTPCALGPSVDASHFARGFYFLLDLGREEAGLLDLEIDTDAGVVVDIGHAEHAEDGRIRALVGGRRFAGRHRTKAGRQSWTRWQRRIAGRFIQLHVRGVKTHFTLHRATVKPVVREVTERHVPSGLNARQAAIWRTAVRTLRLSMHEHYEDCPWREQALYANDARNQILCGRFAFEDDGAFALHSLSLLARGLHDDGWLEMCMPARIPITIPSFTLSWNLALADCLRLYGPSPALAELLPTAKAILDRRLDELEDGLLPSLRTARSWHFYDWADGLSNWKSWLQPGETAPASGRRFDAPLNLLLLLSLEADADVVEAFGDGGTAARWRAAAAKLRARIRTFFWNASARRFDTYRGTDAPRNGHELTQALAILADVVPEGELGPLAEKLSAPSDWVETTLSQSLHKFEALAKAGPVCGRRARRTMEALWGGMLDAGATSFWEMRDGWKAFGGAGSLCHGWSAVPVYFYSMHPELLADEASALRWPTPTREMKPWVYNWWMGSAVDARGLELQCRELSDKGFGGFHVIPIYGAKGGYEKSWKPFLSAEWIEAWNLAVRTAREHGLGVDLTMGSGWCFGGPWIDRAHASSRGQKVKRAGAGGKGYMLDPFSAEAMRIHLAQFEPWFGKGGTAERPRAFYHDSFEYYGAMPKAGTDPDASLLGCFRGWTDWCRANGYLTRNEAHGAPVNWLDFYALADIPETEMFGADCRDVLISKFASSAAHAKGTKLVTAESCTWIDEHFHERPAEIKAFIDRLFLAGVNHVFYHGCCYSPVEAVWPGWCFYASLEMNPRNPIWREMRALNDYVTRCQSIFQTWEPDNDLAILWDVSSFRAKHPDELPRMTVHDTNWFYGEKIGPLARRLADEGYAFDYLSPKMVADGLGRKYAAIVDPEKVAGLERVRRMPFGKASGLCATRWKKDGLTGYFVVNEETPVCVIRSVSGGMFTVMDALLGTIREVPEYRVLRGHSAFVVGDGLVAEKTGGLAVPESLLALDGAWSVKPLCGGPALASQREIPALVGWEAWDDAFSGTMLYRKAFRCESRESVQLDLGDVREIARVRLNGVDLGVRFMPPYAFPVPGGVLKPHEENVLEVEVTNLGANRLRWNDRNGVDWKYFTDANIVTKDYKPLDASTWRPLKSGLLGPVRLSAR